MASINDAVAVLDYRLGFDRARSRTIARRLQESGLLPSGAPGVGPIIGLDHFMNFAMARAIDPALHVVADAVRKYGAMTPGGASLVGASKHIPTARQRLADLAAMALGSMDEQAMLASSAIEFVTTWPEIVVSSQFGVERFRSVGDLASHWDATTHRSATAIPSAALGAAVRDLFQE
ncbi:hypothetical protein [Phreatobacter sp. AB_2022a]|uniref:hypothetical protein n=1 Tax=Phreatobacter sp. AB_2022a TaxID=3003134 RepID=UPI002287550B|nr:hypothetical protein [Phreatobacter sp. AB_2022a]MCZ0734579.1 hypothetical protein [Phreatobacter sp. AB_2022a]